MKQSEYNEIDRLLRSLADRGRVVGAPEPDARDDGTSLASDHLDADELNSYAEGVLPAAARARYTSHLVDCDDCRSLASQLSIAAGRVFSEPDQLRDKTATSTWRLMLAAFFTPAVLRYAIPALAVVVIAFSVIVVRQRDARQSTELARNVKTKVAPVAADNGNLTNRQAGSVAEQESKQVERRGDVANSTPSENKPEAKTENKVQGAAQAGAQPSAETKAPVDAEADKKRDEPRTVAEEQPTFAPEPAVTKPAPAPAPKPTTVAAKAPSPTIDGIAANDKSNDSIARRKESEKSDKAGGFAVSSIASPVRKQAPREKNEKTKDAKSEDTDERAGASGGRADDVGESRTVAGRRFEHRDGVWIDHAYSTSMKTTSVTRGSDQFRALTADEPEIAVIAKQLSGEIIVLWKGHAYRIR
jgi:hypothetical protein